MSEKDERRWRHNFLFAWLRLKFVAHLRGFLLMVYLHNGYCSCIYCLRSSFLNIVDDQQISTIEPDPKYKHTQ